LDVAVFRLVKRKPAIDRSDLAESDLVDIWFHIACDDPIAADRFIDE